MKVEKIKSYVGLLEEAFGEQEIISLEMNEFVIKAEVTWDVFVDRLKANDRAECYGRFDKQNNQLVLSFRCDDGLVLVTKKQV